MTTRGWAWLLGWVALVLAALPAFDALGLPAWTRVVFLVLGCVVALKLVDRHRKPPASP